LGVIRLIDIDIKINQMNKHVGIKYNTFHGVMIIGEWEVKKIKRRRLMRIVMRCELYAEGT
jgi:hypothetical protein